MPKTLEYLETASVPVLGYGTNEFPAFYSRSSGLTLTHRVDSPEEVAGWFKTHLQLGIASALLVANPIPIKDEIPAEEMGSYISEALKKVEVEQISGKELTPFLLNYIVKLTGGRSLKANIALALNNVRLGAQIARAL